nr:peroxisomal membrane protein PEX14 isoform X1 [Tanacetum cinerariifolium]
GNCRLLKGMRLLLVKAFKPHVNSNWWGDFHQHSMIQIQYETLRGSPRGSPRESKEAKSARRSKQPQKGRYRLGRLHSHKEAQPILKKTTTGLIHMVKIMVPLPSISLMGKSTPELNVQPWEAAQSQGSSAYPQENNNGFNSYGQDNGSASIYQSNGEVYS